MKIEAIFNAALGKYVITCEECGLEVFADTYEETHEVLWKHINESHPEGGNLNTKT